MGTPGRRVSSYSRDVVDLDPASTLTPTSYGLGRSRIYRGIGGSQPDNSAYSTPTRDNGRIQGADSAGLEHYRDVQEELDRCGHNLTSVLNNPRETVFDMLYDALDPEQVWCISPQQP